MNKSEIVQRLEAIEKHIGIAKEEQKVDKFAELKEAHRNGAVIQFKDGGGTWKDMYSIIFWDASIDNYRIKPEEKPKIGDVCKFWDDNESESVVGKVGYIDVGTTFPYQLKYGDWYKNAKILTKEEAIKLLFGDE